MYRMLCSLFALFCCVSLMGQTQLTTAPNAVSDEKVNTEKSLLWKISGKSLNNPSYLYGTIHMIHKDDFFLTDSTKSTFDRCERVAFEINLEEMSDMSILFKLMGKIMMDEGTKLADLLNEDDYQKVAARFEDMGLPMAFLDRIKPMFLSTMLAGGESAEGGFTTGDMVSYEMELMEMAKSNDMEMAGLESIAYQLSMFDSIPYKAQAEMLVESLDMETEGTDQFKEMVEVYKAQDIEAMQTLFKDTEGGLGDYEDLLLGNRNRNWIPIMEELMNDKPTFFAVGAGHLGGKAGVIVLLREAGYTVEAIQ